LYSAYSRTAPASAQEVFQGREEDAVGNEANDYDDEHDGDVLVRGVEFSAAKQELADMDQHTESG
jgi:hypothetical protein